LEEDLGSLTPGKRADVVQVDVPASVTDIEEYLVSGIPAAAIDWAVHTRDV
jgi:imidazolonepropionase-like amidohydrolase